MRPIDALVMTFRLRRARAPARSFEAYARLFHEDPEAFNAEKFDLSQNAALEPFISRSLAEYALAPISSKLTLKLAHRLCGAGRHAEAADLLLDARYAGVRNANYHLILATALTGEGRIDDALQAARRSGDLEPSDEAAGLVARLEDLVRLRTQAEASPRWAPQDQYLHALLDVGAFRPATAWLQRRLTDGVDLTPDDLPDLYTSLQVLLSLLDGEDTHGLFQALARCGPAPAAAADLARIVDGLLAPDDAPRPGGWVSDDADLQLAGALAWAAAGKRKAAADALGALTLVRPTDTVVRGNLACVVGRGVTDEHPFTLSGRGGGKIFDTFPFNNELDMLDIKLGSMGGWVDHFVIVEARTTHTGNPKPLHFEANRERFAAYRDKIIHVVVDSFPEHINRPWPRESYQRDMAVQGLSGRCAEDDLVLITDADEIVTEQAVRSFTGEHARLLQERARYFLNYRQALTRDQQRGMVCVWRAKYLQLMTPSYLRIVFAQDKKATRLHDAGWHFTSMADPKGVVNKFLNAAHQEVVNPGEEGIRAHMEAIRAGRTDPGWERCELDERFPPYIRGARAELAKLIL